MSKMTLASEGFLGPKIEPYENAWRLVEDWTTDCCALLPDTITVPNGFVTDGASIPRWLWTICGSPMDVPRIYAAVVHDWLYDHPILIPTRNDDGYVVWVDCTRSAADELYRDMQIAFGISRFCAYTEWLALRACGWIRWHKN